MQTSRHTHTWPLAFLAVWTAASPLSCGDDNLLEPLQGPQTLLDYETRNVCFRFTDDQGFGILGAAIRFDTDGPTAGAVLQRRVSVTDAAGIACVELVTGTDTAFTVVARHDDAKGSTSVPIVVSRGNGGRLAINVHDRANATVEQARVILTEDLDCDLANPLRPPTASTNAANANQIVSVQGQDGTPVTFSGLKSASSYTVVALGESGGQTTGMGCQDQLTITSEQIDQRRPLAVELNIVDFVPTPGDGDELQVVTQFERDIGLTGMAALLKQMSDDETDPADFLLGEMLLYETDTIKRSALGLLRAQLAQTLSATQSVRNAKQHLHETAADLESVKNLRLVTHLAIVDESEEAGTRKSKYKATHRFGHFEADVQGKMTKFDLSASKSRLLGGPEPKLEDEAELRIDNVEDVAIGSHSLSLPIADAIIAKVLLDNWGKRELAPIIQSMVACSELARQVQRLVDDGEVSFDLDQLLKELAGLAVGVWVNDLCVETTTEIVNKVEAQLRKDLKASRMDTDVEFSGQAKATWSDGGRIERMRGKWNAVGSFTALRQY